MLSLRLCLFFSILIPIVLSINFQPVPGSYITQSDITSQPRELFIFNVPLCGGAQYEHDYAHFFVNFPDRKWNPVIGDYVNVTVVDEHGHFMTNNIINGQYKFEFSFLYHKEQGNMRLYVTSGNAPDLKYTITVTFTKSNASQSLPQERFAATEFEEISWQKIAATMPEGNTQFMESVFKTTGTQVVPTADVRGFQLGYCFDKSQFPGSIYLSVQATDEISGFATYACTHEQNCTSVDVAKFFDVTGANVNFVRVRLTDPIHQIGAINVLVRGDGRDNQSNSFILGASKFISDDACKPRIVVV